MLRRAAHTALWMGAATSELGWERGSAPIAGPCGRCGQRLSEEKGQAMALTPIRRVVTGNDERGRSKVVWDGPAPGTHEASFNGRGHTDFWVWRETPPPLNGLQDTGTRDDEIPRPPGGGPPRVGDWLAETGGTPPNAPDEAPQD